MIAALGVTPPAPSTLTPAQERFLLLHKNHVVTKTRWLLGGGQLRAFTERGHTATVSKSELESLIRSGLVEMIAGSAAVSLTKAGLEAVS